MVRNFSCVRVKEEGGPRLLQWNQRQLFEEGGLGFGNLMFFATILNSPSLMASSYCEKVWDILQLLTTILNRTE